MQHLEGVTASEVIERHQGGRKNSRSDRSWLVCRPGADHPLMRSDQDLDGHANDPFAL
jgi:hypothetical protein